MTDNLLFIISALFLTGLIALGSGLQKAPAVQSPVSQPVVQADNTTAPAPAAVAPAPKPSVRGRYTERGDDN